MTRDPGDPRHGAARGEPALPVIPPGGTARRPSPRGERRILGEVHSPGSPAAPRPATEMVSVWPQLLYREMLAALACIVVLTVISLLFNAPLEAPADPAHTPNPAKAPWYFVGLQELLHYFDPWIAGVVIPALIIIGLCAIPYIDPNREGSGVYSVRARPLATGIFLAGVTGWFVLIAIGLWFRGPGWSWVWPWSSAPPAAAGEATRALPNLLGVPLTLAYFVGGGWWIVRKTAAWKGFTRGRRWVFAVLLLAMTGTLLKIVLKLLFGIQYVVRFPHVGFNL